MNLPGPSPDSLRKLCSLLLLAGVLAPLALAGDAADPDISDPARDVTVTPAFVHVPAPEIDLTAVWVERGGSHLGLVFQVEDVSHRIQPDEFVLYMLTFRNAEYESAEVGASHGSHGPHHFFSATRHDGTEVRETLSGTLDAATNTVRVEIPRSLVTSAMEDSVAGTILGLPTPLGLHAGGNVWFRDHAPNDLQGPTIAVE